MGYFPWVLPSLISSAIIVALVLLIWSKRDLAVVKALYASLLSTFIWVFFKLLVIVSQDYDTQLLISKLQYSGIAFTAVTWLIFTLVALDMTHHVTRKNIFWLSVIPIVTFVLALTNDAHGLIWQKIEFVGANVHAEHGGWFPVHIAYSYILITTATGLALIQYLRDQKKRSELVAIILAPLLVFLVNANNLFEVVDVGNFDVVSVAFSFSTLMFTWVVIKNNYLHMAPVALRSVVENMQDSILILDDDMTVIDMNPAAVKLFSEPKGRAVGKPLATLLSDEAMCKKLIKHESTELMVKNKHMQALKARFPVRFSKRDGILIVFRDISELKLAQEKLERTSNELLRANRELQLLANIDHLTGLSNRRYFLELLSQHMARVERHGAELCLMILDLDHFKNINDSHGHPVGDAVLKRVSHIIRDTARKGDVSGRLGGEEFGIILPDTRLDGASVYAERLRRMVQDSHGDDGIGVTVSIGIAAAEKSTTIDELFKQADEALYRAKTMGRNRVVVAPQPISQK